MPDDPANEPENFLMQLQLTAADVRRLMAALENPPPPTPALVRLMRRKPAWS